MDLRIKRISDRKKENITAHLGNEVLFMFGPLALRRGHSAHKMPSFAAGIESS